MKTYNVSPYFDDFDEDKNFHQIMFKPGYAVQARELTQLQTILQNQIERFGQHIFQEGSIVLGGHPTLETDFQYVKLSSEVTYAVASSFVGKTVIGSINGIRAYVYSVADRDEFELPNNILMIRYLSSSEVSDLFFPSEVLTVVDATDSISVADSSVAQITGKGSIFSIDEGVIFNRGYFAKFKKQSVVLDPMSQVPTCKVGFASNVNLINSIDDTTLLDNAQSSYNYAAPGADRLNVDLQLKRVAIDDDTSVPDFVTVFSIESGEVVQLKSRSDYARLYEEFAKRTFDESGDYVVNGFGIRTREHLDTGDNEGYKKLADGGDSTKLAIGIEPGLAYVKGYEVNNRVTKYVTTDKSTSYNFVNNDVSSATTGNYILVQELVGNISVDLGTVVNLYNAAEQRVSNLINGTAAPSSSIIGTAKVKNVVYESTGVYRVYLFDIIMTSSNKFQSVRALGNGTSFFADVILDSGSATLKETFQSSMIFPIGSSSVRSLRNDEGQSDTIFTFRRTNNVTVNVNGTFTSTVSSTNETQAYGDGLLSSTNKQSIILTSASNVSIARSGTVSCSSGGNTLTGVGTTFTRFNVGDKLQITGVTGTYKIASIASDTSLTITKTFASAASGATYVKYYQIGDVIDLTAKGIDSGTTRTVTGSDHSLTFDLKETYGSSFNAVVTYNVTRTPAGEMAKVLKPNRIVKLKCSTLSSLTSAINLGFADVYKIRSITMTDRPTPSNTDADYTTEPEDVTNSFIFDNGQRDDFYDLATITPIASKITLTNDNYLLVTLDYFDPDVSQGVGYFSVDSYPVDDTQTTDSTIYTHQIPVYYSTNGIKYNLRNHFDFRPIKNNTANDSTTVAGASVNPTTTDVFYSDSTGLRSPIPSSTIYCDYSYYLSRRDIVVSDKKGNFEIVKGTADVYPVTPTIPGDVMAIAHLYIPAYPSISQSYGRILNNTNIPSVSVQKVTNTRFTMRDIGVLKQRVENLEYYNALNMLERNVKDMLVLDENGLDRFKNGFFVDGFSDHSLGATDNSDYKIAVDKIEGVIRPKFEMDSFKYDLSLLSSTSTVKTGNLVTLPYTETSLLEQSRVTTIRNIEQSVFRFIGSTTLTPDIDTWVDSTTIDKEFEYGNDTNLSESLTTEWGSWQTYVTGTSTTTTTGSGAGTYSVYARAAGDRTFTGNETLVGTYSSIAEAKSKAQSLYRAFIVTDNGSGTSTTVSVMTTENVRNGVQTSVTIDKKSEQLGNFVTDVSIVPYIRPQTIDVYANGLKANTRYYIFFDGESMDEYLTPRTISTTPTYSAEGSVWRSDAAGQIAGKLRLPASGKRFRIGQKEVIVTDSPTNAPDATSYSKSYFVASGLNAAKQNTILSTKHAVVTKTPVVERNSYTTTTTTTTGGGAGSGSAQNVEVFGPSCMAYSFKVEVPTDQPGTFLTSVDVFIESKDPNLGVWFEIREMSADGGITRTQVPYSEVWYKSADIVTTSDAKTPHKVTFPSPVFLMNDTEYAFVIHTEGLNPNYYFWVSRLGETDIITNTPVTGRQLTGTLYSTNNNLNWTIVPDLDLKVKFNRASFDTNASGVAVFGNRPYEFFAIENQTDTYGIFGETIYGSEILTLSNIASSVLGDTIEVGDRIKGVDVTAGSFKIGYRYIITTVGTTDWNVVAGTSSVSYSVGTVIVAKNAGTGNGSAAPIVNVLSISGSKYYTDLNGFSSGNAITVLTSTNVSRSITATVSSVEYGIANLLKYTHSNSFMVIDKSNGKFFNGCSIIGEFSRVTSKVSSLSSWDYSVVNIKPRNITFPKTYCNFEMRSIDASTGAFGDYVRFTADSTLTLENTSVIKSRSYEVQSLSGSSSSQIRATFGTTSDYISPIIDIGTADAIYVHNIINNDATDEDGITGGNLLNKYISKTVTLADGQDAEDLIAMISAYLPVNSDVKVWMKIINGEDTGTTLEQRPWIEMERDKTGIYSSSLNQNDFISFTFNIPTSMKTGAGGAVQYTSDGKTYTSFKQFAIKIGLLGTDSARVPRVGDLKAIALQM